MVLYQIVTVKINLITQLKYNNLDGKNHHFAKFKIKNFLISDNLLENL